MPQQNPAPTSAERAVQSALSATAILVLGMHRSGTSAIARVLNLRGADLGRDLLPAKQDNERGFWENAAILGLHERFFARQQWQWHDLLTPKTGWQHDAPARELVAGLPAVLEQQYGDSRLLLVKDPRLSLLAPLWIEALAAQRTRVAFVIMVRHPDEIAASLAKRDGFSPARSHWLWLQHVVEAERATRGHARVFVHYERLLADWHGELARVGKQLDITWPAQPADFERAVAQFIAPELRHHRGGSEANAALPPMIRRVYERTCVAASDAVSAAAGFDDVLTGFDEWMQLAAPLVHDLTRQLTDAEAQHALEIDNARVAFSARAAEIAAARSNIDALAVELEQARAAHDARDQLEADLRAQLQDRDGQIERARAAFAAKEAEVDAARNNMAELNADLDRARATIEVKDREIEVARITTEAKDREIEVARANIQALAAEIAQARDVFALKEKEIAVAQHALADLQDSLLLKDREIDAARGNIDGLVAQIDAARRNIDNLVAEIDRARQAHGARDATEAALRQTLWYRLGHRLGLIGGKDR